MSRVVLFFAIALSADALLAGGATRSLQKAAVWVLADNAGGAGCVIDTRQRLLLTNCHVVKQAKNVLVIFPEWNEGKVNKRRNYYWKNWRSLAVKARVVHRDAERDLALVQVSKLPASVRALRFARRLPDQSDLLYRMGSPGAAGTCWAVSTGRVNVIHEDVVNYPQQKLRCRFIKSDMPGINGHSGAAVVNADGELVGIHSGAHKGKSIAIARGEVHAFIADYFLQSRSLAASNR